jgi:hypothetical protein
VAHESKFAIGTSEEKISSSDKGLVIVVLGVKSINSSGLLLAINSNSLEDVLFRSDSPSSEKADVAVSSFNDLNSICIKLSERNDSPVFLIGVLLGSGLSTLLPVGSVDVVLGDHVLPKLKANDHSD